ncbi:MAG: phospholipase A [Campylobacterales bacterium]
MMRLVAFLIPVSLWAVSPGMLLEPPREPSGATEPAAAFRLMSHKPSYLLPFITDRVSHDNRMATEAKFRLSLKRPLLISPGGPTVYLAYSQLSLWQFWDEENSRPFRETNYNPEVFIHAPFPRADITFFKWWRAGIEHESNGLDLPNSRSWDRAYGVLGAAHGKWRFEFKGWYRFPETEKTDANDTKGDDNPDIDRYYGYGEVTAIFQSGKSQWRLLARQGSHRGAFELGYSRPMAGNLFFYAQAFSGYGESLIDYDRRVEKFGFGVMFSRGEI